MKYRFLQWILVLFGSCFILSAMCQVNEQKSKEGKTIKPKYLWFDASANFKLFSEKKNITHYLDKAKEIGFTQIVVDVRPCEGDVLYKKTKTMQQLTRLGDRVVERKWDYLDYFIKEAKKRGLKVSVSATINTGGSPKYKQGIVYRDKSWEGKTAKKYTPQGIIDIKDDETEVSAFLNPLLPEVQDYILTFVEELVTNYDFDAFVLDYCRYAGIGTDFSETTRNYFEKYIGEKVERFPEDIFTWESDGKGGYFVKEGKWAKKWFEFRSTVIHDEIAGIRAKVKSIKPQVDVEYWAASWYGYVYSNGQNWAGKSYDPATQYTWASPDYYKTGFADLLDVFIIGTYLEKVYGLDDPESIESGLANGKRLIGNACKMYGSLYAQNWKDIEDATYVCLTQSEGLMIFDIVQVIEHDLWDEIKRGIERSGY